MDFTAKDSENYLPERAFSLACPKVFAARRKVLSRQNSGFRGAASGLRPPGALSAPYENRRELRASVVISAFAFSFRKL